MSSEQATNSHEEVTAKLESLFGGGEEPAQQERPRNADGTFAKPVVEGEEAAQTEEQQAEATEQESTQQQPQEREVVIDGETYVVPVKIADRFIQHADYTRKTQDLAELRRSVSAEREASAVDRAFEQSVFAERNQLALLEAQISSFASVNWQALETDQLLKARASLDQLKDAKAQIQESLKAKRADFDQKIKGHLQEAIEAGQKYIAQHIKTYDEPMKQKLMEYGLAEGYTREEMSQIRDPRIVVSLWKAWQWDQLKASQPELKNRAQKAAPVVRPGATQRQVPRVQQVKQGIKQAKTTSGKTRAAEDYFTERFS